MVAHELRMLGMFSALRREDRSNQDPRNDQFSIQLASKILYMHYIIYVH